MFLESCIVALWLTSRVASQNLPATDQTSFSYPANGAGVTVPFPPQLAALTGLSDWPARDVTPPFTPNMASTFKSASVPNFPHSSDCTQVPANACSMWCNGCYGSDIVSAPDPSGIPAVPFQSL